MAEEQEHDHHEALPDHVEVFEDTDGQWRWRRFDGNNGKELSQSSEAYEHRKHAIEEAVKLNPDASVKLPEDAADDVSEIIDAPGED